MNGKAAITGRLNPFNWGVTEDMALQLKRQVNTTNIVAIAQVIVYFLFFIITFISQNDFLAWFPNLIGFFIAQAPLYLNYKKYYTLSLYYICISIGLYITFCVFIWGIGKGTQFYILLNSVLPAILIRNRKKMAFFWSINFICYISCLLMGTYLKPIYTNESWGQMWYANIITVFILFVIIIITFDQSLSSYQKQINIQNKELQKAVEVKDKIYSIVAHDLKNPMSMIRSLSDILYKEQIKEINTYQRNLIAGIKESAEVTFELVRNLLDWARSQSGRIIIEKELLNYDIIVDSVIKMLGPIIKKKKINIIKEYSPALKINCDINTFTSVLRNIIINAITYSCESGEIIMSATETDDAITLHITDHGKGLETGIPDSINDSENNILPSNNQSHTGLGLIICREFMELNEGKFVIKNNEGPGCTCRLIFPKSW